MPDVSANLYMQQNNMYHQQNEMHEENMFQQNVQQNNFLQENHLHAHQTQQNLLLVQNDPAVIAEAANAVAQARAETQTVAAEAHVALEAVRAQAGQAVEQARLDRDAAVNQVHARALEVLQSREAELSAARVEHSRVHARVRELENSIEAA